MALVALAGCGGDATASRAASHAANDPDAVRHASMGHGPEDVAGDAAAPASDARPRTPPVVPAGVVVPPGMAYVPGGRTLVGTADDEGGLPHEKPAFWVDVAPFALDKTPVTVAAFRQFAERAGFETQAEAFGDGAVLVGGAWALVPGADRRHPQGPDGPAAPDSHPVTQVSYRDAAAFCAAAGKRLPTEVEWEHAARGAVNRRDRYPWGAETPDAAAAAGRPTANSWQGEFPARNTGADGFLTTSPVGTFGETELGLSDLAGNVWEWVDGWYRPYPLLAAGGSPPPGPSGEPERVQRGGSFLCTTGFCHGYRVSGRGHATPESSLYHVGFRCAASGAGG